MEQQPTRLTRETSVNRMQMRAPIWATQFAWVVLPITTGSALADVFNSWSRAPSIVSGVLLWGAWFAGLVALLTLRPWGFTALRVVAPAAAALAIASAWSAPASTAAFAIAWSVLSMFGALSSPVAHACAASTAYGPERRFPLRVPLTLLAGPLPISVVLIIAGIASGPLLLANGDIVAGVIALVLGVPIVGVLARALAGLDHRWIVLVPAGLVVVDPLTFPDPVLLPREQIESVHRRAASSPPSRPSESEILVGGRGPIVIACRESGSFLRRAGRGRVTLDADRLQVTPVRPAVVLAAAGAHRISVR